MSETCTGGVANDIPSILAVCFSSSLCISHILVGAPWTMGGAWEIADG